MRIRSILAIKQKAALLLVIGALMQCGVTSTPETETRTFAPTELPKFCTPPSKVFRKVEPSFTSQSVMLPLELIRYRLPKGDYAYHLTGFEDGCERRLQSSLIEFMTYNDLWFELYHFAPFENQPKMRNFVNTITQRENGGRILEEKYLLVIVKWKDEGGWRGRQELFFNADGFVLGSFSQFSDAGTVYREINEVNADH